MYLGFLETGQRLTNCWLYPGFRNPLELTGVGDGGSRKRGCGCVRGREEGAGSRCRIMVFKLQALQKLPTDPKIRSHLPLCD